METQELLIDLSIVGGSILAHIGIIANRYMVRPALRSKFPKYDGISLQLEHVIHHASFALALGVAFKYIKIDPKSIPVTAACASLGKGIYWDGLKEKKPQLDQLVSDTIGSGIGYCIISSL